MMLEYLQNLKDRYYGIALNAVKNNSGMRQSKSAACSPKTTIVSNACEALHRISFSSTPMVEHAKQAAYN